MKNTIYTIPINEVFEPVCGCPICALEAAHTKHWVEYITGAAMMEPDVRVETNKRGFCGKHFDMMLDGCSRLALALIIQTRLTWIDQSFDRLPAPKSGAVGDLDYVDESHCFICNMVESGLAGSASNIVAVWEREYDFRVLYAAQEFLCPGHAKLLLVTAGNALKRRPLTDFREITVALTRKRLWAIRDDINAFCNLFDYRSADRPHPGEKTARAVEHAVSFLTSWQ